MKKLLSILGAAGLVVSTSAVLVSCGTKEEDKNPATATKVAVDKAIEAIKTATATKPADANAVKKIVEAELAKINADVEGGAAKTLTADSIKILAVEKPKTKDESNEVTYTVSALKTIIKEGTPAEEQANFDATDPTKEYEFDVETNAVDATDVTIAFGTTGTEDVALNTLIKITEVTITKADGDVTGDELIAAINAANTGAEGKYSLGEITQPIDKEAGKATATGKEGATGTVEITFTVTTEE